MTEPFNMIDAPSFRYGAAACTVKNTEVMLVRITDSNTASVVPPIGVLPAMPALANTMSSLPNFLTACRIALFGHLDVGRVGDDRQRIRPQFLGDGLKRRLIAPGDGAPGAFGHE